MNEFMNEILNLSINMLLIMGVLFLMWALVVAAAFLPVSKNRKHKEKVAEANREYNKIAVEFTHMERAKAETNEELKKLYWRTGNQEQLIKDLDEQIALKQKELEDLKPKKQNTKK